MRNVAVKIIKASYHRNGVCGEGFYAIIFTSDCKEVKGPMFAALFDAPGYCAVTEVAKLAENNIEFAGGNSWRGDVFEEALRPALKAYLEENVTNRIGPFAMPGAAK